MGSQLMMTQKLKTSHSYNQHQLKIICDQLCENIESLIETLDVQGIRTNGKMLVGCCPIHNGDNATAFNLYPEGDDYRGNWKCRTHGCEKTFKASIIGFIRGVISNKNFGWQKQGDETATFQETIDFIRAFLGKDMSKIKISKKDIEKKTFSSIVKNVVSEKNEENTAQITRETVRKSLVIPCEYFLNRGFSRSILEAYDIGLCDRANKEMHNRAVVPVYDHNYKFVVACSGRSIFNKCEQCKCYHDNTETCPIEEDRWKYPKWKHNKNFKSQNHLYNYWMAKKHILDSTKVVLVESPGNVWRLEEAGIHNSVAIFGSSLSDRQKIILDGSGAMTIILVMDSDEAGEKAAISISNKCKNTYNIVNIKISKLDIAEMSIEEIKKEVQVHI